MTTFSKHDLKVGNHLYFERGELIDDALYAELNNLSFPLHKSNSLEEINEQIRLIENITADNQALYFGENELVDTGLNDDRPYKPADKDWGADFPRWGMDEYGSLE